MSTYAPRHSPSSFSTPASTTLFRRLTWEGTVPLEIRVDSKELPANSDRGLECYYIQAPRVSYLPLLVPEIKRFLMDVVFDEAAARTMKEEDWWFESEEGATLKWHWPIGLIYDNHTISQTVRSSAHPHVFTPLRMVLHLASPPTEKLLLAPSPDACKQAFMGQLKEADFIRWGTRSAEQDGLWEGIKEHNFDEYWRVASKITPTTAPTRSHSPPPPQSSTSLHVRPPSADPGSNGAPDRDGASNVRNIPVRIYLPDGPVLQDLVPPMLENGRMHTLAVFLSTRLPLIFSEAGSPQPNLGYPLVQGVPAPPDTEMAWLGACMAGADGWVNVCIGMLREGMRYP
ncbi:autophagy protein Apg5-domain-containing protein [Epithele typhae]|uniref:autophagy protein Apg5-domain-containing protein n=1 Tax=Epithele typhae TaxID=378194 RepID=UPI002007D8DD|nr:autophagy protein Apg5-domain-containing protein [Epithele typhae]KAH9917865.1 autophagy protein Apg5-domain-containing protein [Epithele typhae]